MTQQARRGNAGYRRDDADIHPPYLYPDYVSTRLRAPKKPLIILPKTLSDTTGPAYGRDPIGELDNDLTRQHAGELLGERIIVTGRVTEGDGRPVRNSLIEIWQANAAGRYTHQNDRHPAPLDPNFSDAGRCLTDDEGFQHNLQLAELDYVTNSQAAATSLPRTMSDKLSRSDSGVGGWNQFNRAVEKKNRTIGGSNGSQQGRRTRQSSIPHAVDVAAAGLGGRLR